MNFEKKKLYRYNYAKRTTRSYKKTGSLIYAYTSWRQRTKEEFTHSCWARYKNFQINKPTGTSVLKTSELPKDPIVFFS